MGRVAKKFAKQKEREREVRKKILTRRNKIQQEVKEHRAKELLEYKYRNKVKPFLSEEKTKQIEIRKALEHNLEILKALEDEYLSNLSEEEKAKLPNPEDVLKEIQKGTK